MFSYLSKNIKYIWIPTLIYITLSNDVHKFSWGYIHNIILVHMIITKNILSLQDYNEIKIN